MAVSRADVVDRNFIEHVATLTARAPRRDLDSPVQPGSRLTGRRAIELFEVQVESRMCDLLSRELKKDGNSFYTIGSSGHEGNAAIAMALQHRDPAFLHYRSGAFFLARCRQLPGPYGPLDVLLGVTASSDEPIAGGRHKVFGSLDLDIPPQTSTIASQLPKALGCAVAIDRRARLLGTDDRRIVVCSMGDASSNHSTAAGALNAASWTTFQNVPAPVLFVCEDNGLGISVRTPEGWIANSFEGRRGLRYFFSDGLDAADAFDTASAAVDYVRRRRHPAFLHMRTVRLLGHAGSDVEQLYRTKEEIEEGESRDPLRRTATMLVECGWLGPDEVMSIYEGTRARITALAHEAVRRPRITTREAVMTPLFTHDPQAVAAAVPVASAGERDNLWRSSLPEASDRPRHLAFQLNRALHDVLLGAPEAIVFGEDVAKKGGVYHVTANLVRHFGVGRVFNTLLDEQTILGLAIGAGHAGMLPIPEIQYLAYLMNAIDQLRGEAGSMQFFSQGQYRNPMVVRIAGLAYQKGFGGHFHNDNGIAALLEVPGLLIGCPSRGDDAARMLRTMVAAAREHGRVCINLEPIALYMTKDLHDDGDGAWLTSYPPPHESLAVGEVGVYDAGDDDELCIASYANGLWMSLRVAERLRARGHRVRVVDLRWLMPLPVDAVAQHASSAGRLLIVDECRKSSGIASALAADIGERLPGLPVHRVTAPDTYIPLGAAANLVLVSEDDIQAGALHLLEGP